MHIVIRSESNEYVFGKLDICNNETIMFSIQYAELKENERFLFFYIYQLMLHTHTHLSFRVRAYMYMEDVFFI